MNVVVRSVQAAGMAVFAAMHVLQVASAPAGSPLWLSIAFALAAVAAVVIAGGLIVADEDREGRWELAAAGLALAAAAALLASFTVGFFGVVETDLRAEVALVIIAEVMTLGAYVIGSAAQSASDADLRESATIRDRA